MTGAEFDPTVLDDIDRRNSSGERLCSLEACDGPRFCKNMCARHWRRWARTGQPEGPPDGVAVAAIPAWVDLDRLARIVPVYGWETSGLCRNRDPALYYPEGPVRESHLHDLCGGCPVLYDCLGTAVALPEHDDHGIWGRTTRRQRRLIRRALTARRAAA